MAADLVLPPQRLHGAQIIKQADVLMLHHLVPGEVETGSLGPNLDFYLPRTAHGSSLSPAITAALLARVGRGREALELLRLALRMDLDDLTGATPSGLHVAAMGGAWQAIVQGFGGLSVHGGALEVDPMLPPGWERLRLRLRCLGRRVSGDPRARPGRAGDRRAAAAVVRGADRDRAEGRAPRPHGRGLGGRAGEVMTEVLVLLDRRDRVGPVLGVASIYARLLGADVVVHAVPELLGAARAAASPSVRSIHALDVAEPGWVVARAARPAAVLVVVAGQDVEHGGRCADFLTECPTPVLVVPETLSAHDVVGPTRVLAPLDGTPESTAAIVEAMALFGSAGAEIVVLHVFDHDTVPAFWDQPVHARRSWGEEFLARHVHGPGIRLELRAGAPGEEVLAVADAEDADLIALGWSRNLSAGHARTVRDAVGRARVPVLLVPLRGPAPARRDRHHDADGPGGWS